MAHGFQHAGCLRARHSVNQFKRCHRRRIIIIIIIIIITIITIIIITIIINIIIIIAIIIIIIFIIITCMASIAPSSESLEDKRSPEKQNQPKKGVQGLYFELSLLKCWRTCERQVTVNSRNLQGSFGDGAKVKRKRLPQLLLLQRLLLLLLLLQLADELERPRLFEFFLELRICILTTSKKAAPHTPTSHPTPHTPHPHITPHTSHLTPHTTHPHLQQLLLPHDLHEHGVQRAELNLFHISAAAAARSCRRQQS
jgi:hypothetical protein